jgi:hypothetical protein
VLTADGNLVTFGRNGFEGEAKCLCCAVDTHSRINLARFYGECYGKMRGHLPLITLQCIMADAPELKFMIEQHPRPGPPLAVDKRMRDKVVKSNPFP